MKPEVAITITILKCPSCGARLEEPGLCVYCGNKLNIEGLTKDERLRDLEMERQIFLSLQRLAGLIGVDVELAIEPSDDLCFAYFAKKAGNEKRDLRKVGKLSYERVGNGVEYRLNAVTKNEAARHTHWLRIRSFGIPDNTRLYECSNDSVDFLGGTLDIEDIKGPGRNPIWLMLVQMLNNIDPEASKRLRRIAMEYERRNEPEGCGEQVNPAEAIARGIDSLVEHYFGWLEDRGISEFGDDPFYIIEAAEQAKQLLEKVESLLTSITNLEMESLQVAEVVFELRRELNSLLSWIGEVEENNWGSREQTRELKARLINVQRHSDKILRILSGNHA